MELKQRLNQWSSDEPGQALSSINNNSPVEASGLRSTVYNDSVSLNKKLLKHWLH